MSDGNTTDTSTQEHQEKITALEAEVEKQKGRVENAEQLVQKWSNEVGDIRKEREALKAETDALAVKLKELDALKEKLVQTDATTTAKGSGDPGKKEPTLEEVEKSLSEDAKKVCEAAFGKLTDDEKIQFRDDEGFRKDFFLQAAEIKPVPTSPWLTSPKKKSEETPSAQKKRIRELFEVAQKQSKATPVGSSGGELASRAERSGAEDTGEKRRLAGILGRNRI